MLDEFDKNTIKSYDSSEFISPLQKIRVIVDCLDLTEESIVDRLMFDLTQYSKLLAIKYSYNTDEDTCNKELYHAIRNNIVDEELNLITNILVDFDFLSYFTGWNKILSNTKEKQLDDIFKEVRDIWI